MKRKHHFCFEPWFYYMCHFSPNSRNLVKSCIWFSQACKSWLTLILKTFQITPILLLKILKEACHRDVRFNESWTVSCSSTVQQWVKKNKALALMPFLDSDSVKRKVLRDYGCTHWWELLYIRVLNIQSNRFRYYYISYILVYNKPKGSLWLWMTTDCWIKLKSKILPINFSSSKVLTTISENFTGWIWLKVLMTKTL